MNALNALLEPLLAPEEEELGRKKTILTGLETQLADRELELASLLADLIHFEKRYLQTVGRRYATLDVTLDLIDRRVRDCVRSPQVRLTEMPIAPRSPREPSSRPRWYRPET